MSAQLRSLLPGRSDYANARRTWRIDALAGLTVGVVALPLALAFGVSSGVGAEAGIVTAIVAGVVAAIFGGSNVQVSGPTGAMVGSWLIGSGVAIALLAAALRVIAVLDRRAGLATT